LVVAHLWFEQALQRPAVGDVARGPESGAHAREVCDAQDGSFEPDGACHGNAENVCLELTEQFVSRGAAVYLQLRNLDASSDEPLNVVTRLVGQRFDARATLRTFSPT
jgi:hypothetical protein